jgi:16S rRNA (cytosine967-C5)-methyltransferase
VSAEKPRQIAVRILQRQAERTDYLETLLDQELSRASLAPADRRLVQELTCGVVRWQATLDWLIARKTDGRMQKVTLQILLRLGLYQMFWLDRIPDHAAVHETVEMAKQLGFGPQAGFINAVLRGYVRESKQTEDALQELKQTQPALGYSQPPWLCARWEQRWGIESLRLLLEWNNIPPPTYARLNTLRADATTLTALWSKEGVQWIPRRWDWTDPDLVFELTSHPSLVTLPSFQQGMFYVQDPSTLLAVHELQPQPSEEILDLCAAPGGKTTFLAQVMGNTGRIVAQDVAPDRLELLRQNCARLGATCVVSAAGDTSQSQAALSGSPLFDRVLVDAPCSNTGVLRRRIDLRWRLRPEELRRLQHSQLKLMRDASGQVKPGGTLVYSTCSLEPEENTDVVMTFLNAQPQFTLEGERTVLPFVEGVDGAFVAKLRRRV